MATENFIIKFDVETTELTDAAGKVKVLGNSVESLSKAVKDVPMGTLANGAKQAGVEFDKATKEIDEQAVSLRELKKAYQDLVTQASRVGENTLKGKEFLKQAGAIQDKIGDLRAATKAYASDTGLTDAVIQGISGISAAYQVAGGAAQLFGANQKDLEKTFQKLQVAMALTNGLQQIQNILQKESAFSLKILAPLQRAWTVAIESTSLATRTLKAALITSGVGALVIAIGYAVSKIIEWSEADEEKIASQKKLNEEIIAGKDATDNYRKSVEQSLGASEATKRKEEAENLKNANTVLADILKDKKRLLDESNGQILFDVKNERFATKEIINEYDKRNIGITTSLRALNDLYEQEVRIRTRIRELTKPVPIKSATKEKETEVDKLTEIELLGYDERQLKINEMDEKWAIRYEQLKAEEFAKLENMHLLSEQKKTEIAEQEALKRAEYEYQAQQTAINSAIATAQQTADAIFDVQAANIQSILNLQLSALDTAQTNELKNKRLTDKQRIDIEKKYQAEQNKLKTDAAKKQRDAEVSQAIVNGSLAITNILANTVDPTGVLKAILIAQAIAATAIQVAKIKSTPLPQYAQGTRYVTGPGTETSDSIIARLSKGERVVTAKRNKEYTPVLDAIHSGFIPAELLNSIALNYTGAISTTKQELNYDRLGKVISKEMESVMYWMQKENNRANVINVNVNSDYNHRKN